MNILVVGAFAHDHTVYTYATSFYHALIKLGHTVTTYNYRPAGLLRKFTVNHDLISSAHKVRPDILFLIKAETITARTIRLIKQQHSCRIITFYPDNPFTLWNGNSHANVLERLPDIDCFLTWTHMLADPLRSAGCTHVCHFPFAYDEGIFDKPIAITEAEHKKYVSDVCFVGTWEPEREQWLAELHQRLPHISLAIWGNHWHTRCTSSYLAPYIRGTAVYNDTMIKIFRSSKIVLNFIRTQNMTSHNMRTFEVPASGSFLLTQRTYEQAQLYFKEDESIVCFDTINELVNKIILYLEHDDRRRAIAHKSYQRAQEFSISKQLKKYFESCPLMTAQGSRSGNRFFET
jgi:spore maturation protein CgeB